MRRVGAGWFRQYLVTPSCLYARGCRPIFRGRSEAKHPSGSWNPAGGTSEGSAWRSWRSSALMALVPRPAENDRLNCCGASPRPQKVWARGNPRQASPRWSAVWQRLSLSLNSCRTEGTPPSGQGDVTVSLTLHIKGLACYREGGGRAKGRASSFEILSQQARKLTPNQPAIANNLSIEQTQQWCWSRRSDLGVESYIVCLIPGTWILEAPDSRRTPLNWLYPCQLLSPPLISLSHPPSRMISQVRSANQ